MCVGVCVSSVCVCVCSGLVRSPLKKQGFLGCFKVETVDTQREARALLGVWMEDGVELGLGEGYWSATAEPQG